MCPSQVRVAQEFGERDHCDLSPFLPLLLGFLGGPLVPLVSQMMTVQHPPEVLAKKPACSLVREVSPGLQLPFSSPYGSGCLSLVGDGLQPAISVPFFVLCAVLAVSYVLAFRVVAIPQSGLLAHLDRSDYSWGVPARFLQISAAHASRASLPCPHFPVVDAGVCAAFLLGELLLGL